MEPRTPPRVRPVDQLCITLERAALDFGEIDADTSAIARVSLHNPMPFFVELELDVGAPFSVSPQTLRLEAGASRLIDVTASPRDGLVHKDVLVLEDRSVVGGCIGRLPMSVVGGNRLVVADTLDFGFVGPGQGAHKTLRFTNYSSKELELGALQLAEGTSFQVLPTAVTKVPPADSVELVVMADPPALAVAVDTLTFGSARSRSSVSLRAVGAWPVAEHPAVVDFHRVGLFPTGRSFSDRLLWLQNTGVSGANPETQLRLVGASPSIETLEGPSGEPELTFDLASAASPIAQGGQVSLALHFVPRALGARRWKLTFTTNDPTQPSRTVEVRAEVQRPPNCTVTTSPNRIAGLVLVTDSSGQARGTFTFTNLNSVSCLLDDVRFAEGTPEDVFRLASGPIEQLELPPGASHQVEVLASSTGGVRQRGELRYHVMSEGELVRQVPFVATVP